MPKAKPVNDFGRSTVKRITVPVSDELLAELEKAKRPGESLAQAASLMLERGLQLDATLALAGQLKRSEDRAEAAAAASIEASRKASDDVAVIREKMKELVGQINTLLKK